MGLVRKQNFKKLTVQFACYGGVGIVGTGIHYSAFLIAIQLNLLEPVYASAAGFLFGAITNYYFNYYITFKSNNNHPRTMLKFFSVALLGLAFNCMGFYVSYTLYKFHYLLSQIFATSVVFILTFSLNRIWTYKSEVGNE